MLFTKQKALIGLLFFLLPITAVLAFVETPVVSGIALAFALKITRFRTGLRIDTRAWEVDPLSFSASLHETLVGSDSLNLRASKVSVQLSPVSLLLFGDFHLREITIESPFIYGQAPPRWFAPEKPGAKSKPAPSDLPTWVGERIAAVIGELKQRNLSFDLLTVRGMRSQVREFQLQNGDIQVENLDGGQVRAEWNLTDFSSPGRVATLGKFGGSVALLRDRQKAYSFSAQKVHVAVAGALEAEFNGRWPGNLDGHLEAHLDKLADWLKASPIVAENVGALPKASGSVSVKLQGVSEKNRLKTFSGSLKTEKLMIDDYVPNDVEAEFKRTETETEITNLRLTLPASFGDAGRAPGVVSVPKISIVKGLIKGKAHVEKAGLCGILTAASVEDCYVDLHVSGDAPFEGELEPFNLRALPELSSDRIAVNTDPFKREADTKENLLAANGGKLTGSVVIQAKELHLSGVRMVWPGGSEVTAEGRIAYNPAIVDLNVSADKARLENILEHFLNLRLQGSSKVVAHVAYDDRLTHEQGRTRVTANISSENWGIESENFGLLTGEAVYENNRLKIGPAKISNGGGRALVTGLLYPTPEGSKLQLQGKLERLEVDAHAPDAAKSLFHGFVSGTADLAGYLDFKRHPDEFLHGPIKLEVDTLTAFDIPYQSASADTYYTKQALDIRDVKAHKSVGFVQLWGRLEPVSGTELKFLSNEIPVKSVGWSPSLEAFQEGYIQVDDGFWAPARGWKVHGQLRGLKIAGRYLSPGTLEISGSKDAFRVAADLGPQMRLTMDSDMSGRENRWTRFKADLKDDGIYAVFAWLKKWNNENPVTTKGEINVDWTPNGGSLSMRDVDLSAPEGSDALRAPLLKVEGLKKISWEKNRVKENNFTVTGPSNIAMTGAVGATEVELKADFPSALLDLFVPTFKFGEGRLKVTGTIPLPPDLMSFQATGSTRDTVLTVPGLGQPITKTRVDMELADGQINFKSARGQLGNGEISASGVYKIDLRKPGLFLDANLNRAQIITLEDVPMEATGDISLKGDQPPYLLSGKILVTNALYTDEFGAKDVPLTAPSADPSLRFALDVEIGTGCKVRNTSTSATVSGTLSMTGTDLKPEVVGNVDIVSGSVFSRNKEFSVSQGRISFTGASKIPTVNLLASTVIKQPSQDYRIQLQIRGPGDQLNLDLTSDPTLPASSIVNLLAFGVLPPSSDVQASSLVNTARSEQYQSSAANAARYEALQAAFGGFIGANLSKSTGFAVRIEASSDIAQQNTIPKVTVERKLSNKVTATFGNSLDFTRPETNFHVDYNLLNNVNLTGVWEKYNQNQDPTNPTYQETTSMGVDLRFKFNLK